VKVSEQTRLPHHHLAKEDHHSWLPLIISKLFSLPFSSAISFNKHSSRPEIMTEKGM
jgi:hypothetical protein